MITRLIRASPTAIALAVACLLWSPAAALEKPSYLQPSGINGALVILGGGKMPAQAIGRFMELAGGEKARLVIIPTARDDATAADTGPLLAFWKERKPAYVTMIHTRSTEKANHPEFTEPLRQATGVWFDGGLQARIADAYVGTVMERELYELLRRGGVIGGTSAGAAVMSRLMIAGGNPTAKTGQGFDLLPGTVVDQHFLKRNRQGRLTGVLERNPGLVGFGIDEDTALIVQGRQLQVVGESSVTVCLAASPAKPARTMELKPGAIADLTTLRKAAIARGSAPFPPKECSASEVAGKGSLVIVGGGGMTRDMTRKFIELAGGPDALIVVLPTAMTDEAPPKRPGEMAMFEKAGAKNVKSLPARGRAEVDDPKNVGVLKQARGIWFGGGRQWRFVDAYEGTQAIELFHDVLRRGGVIGGSSAGATIQGDYLCRGSLLGNLEMMCEGYERGFAFLPGVAIDQHFAQRRRFVDMTGLVKSYPQFLGIGIDETTALIVQGHTAAVMGRNRVHFYDARKPAEKGKPDYESVESGGRYDLKGRKVLGPH